MPQFETTFLLSQIFWVICRFVLLDAMISGIVFPMYRKVFQERDSALQTPLKKADEWASQAETLHRQLEQKNAALVQKNEACLKRLNQKYSEALESELISIEKKHQSALKQMFQKIEKEEQAALKNMSQYITAIYKEEK